MSSPPAKRTRVRTESQLNQKRLADRLKHRENRQENKNRLDKMESDISDIKSALQGLALHLQVSGPARAPTDIAGPNHRELALEPSSRSSHGAFHNPSASATPPFVPGSHIGSDGHTLFGQQVSWAAAPSPHTTMSWRGIESKVINCQCGSPHFDQFDCIDQCTITTFYQHQVAFSTMMGPAGRLPRNPSLPAMMLHNMEESVATFLITGFLRQYRNKGIEQLLSFYLLGYRYMRWQMNPTEETIRDVPPWLLPTETQKLNPHPVVVDYLPWPALRDYLCISKDEDSQRSLNIYLESMQFNWSSERPLFFQDEDGQMSVSPEFELAVGTLENWHMGPPWSNAFPHLVHLIRPG